VVDVDEQSPASAASPTLFATPVSSQSRQDLVSPEFNGTTAFDTPLPMHTPAFHKKSRMAEGAIVGAAFDIFADDDDEFEQLSQARRKRMRTSWGSSARWKVVDSAPSPDNDISLEDALEASSQEADDPAPASTGPNVAQIEELPTSSLDQPSQVAVSLVIGLAPETEDIILQEPTPSEAQPQPVDELLPVFTENTAPTLSPAFQYVSQELSIPDAQATSYEIPDEPLLPLSIPSYLLPQESSSLQEQELGSSMQLLEAQEHSAPPRPDTPKFEIMPDAAFQFSFISPRKFDAPGERTSEFPTIAPQAAQASAFGANAGDTGYFANFDEFLHDDRQTNMDAATSLTHGNEKGADGFDQERSEALATEEDHGSEEDHGPEVEDGSEEDSSDEEETGKLPQSDDFGPFETESEGVDDENPPTNEIVELVEISGDESEDGRAQDASESDEAMEDEPSGDKVSPFKVALDSPQLDKSQSHFVPEDEEMTKLSEGPGSDDYVSHHTSEEDGFDEDASDYDSDEDVDAMEEDSGPLPPVKDSIPTVISLLDSDDDEEPGTVMNNRPEAQTEAKREVIADSSPWEGVFDPGFSERPPTPRGQAPITVVKESVDDAETPHQPVVTFEEISFQTTVVGQDSQQNIPHPEAHARARENTAMDRPLSRQTTFASFASQALGFPVGASPEPKDTTHEPDVATTGPEDTTQEPVDITPEPEASTQKPAGSTQELEDTTQDPNTTQDPDTTQDPEELTQDIEASAQEPGARTQNPDEATQEEPALPAASQNGTSPPVEGLRTSKSYYTPLAHVAALVNRQKPRAFDDTAIDILAVVTSAAAKPKRAKDSPKNFSTTLRVTQPGLHPHTMSVTLFHGKQGVLPKASRGEVVLISGLHAVGLHGGGIGLQGDNAAWCVWRKDKQQRKDVTWVEEMRGLAVEIGAEERAAVLKLREWFRGL
jgi:hypothetical protein